MRVYGYLRASTKEQDATRAKEALINFAQNNDIVISSFTVENESGAKLERPKLFELFNLAQKGDIILIEQVDRLTRLKADDWEQLKQIIKSKGLRIISMDLPTSFINMATMKGMTANLLKPINEMLFDLLALFARKDYEDRRRRQAEGIKKAKEANRYKGRPEDRKLRSNIEVHLKDGKSYNEIQSLLGCSRHTISKVSKLLKEERARNGKQTTLEEQIKLCSK